MVRTSLLYPELSYRLNGLAFETHNALGRYRNEKQYGDHYEHLLQREGIRYVREYRASPSFATERIGRNIIDFLIEDAIVIEFKVATIITKDDYFQVQRYLHATNKELGIIMNFRQKTIKPRRVLNGSMFRSHSEHSD